MVFEHIPEDLKELPQWVTWRLQKKEQRMTKVPYCPQTHRYAATTRPATWSSFRAALYAMRRYSDDGIGFVFTQSDPFVGIDLDHCRNPESGVIAEWAMPIINILATYTEVSQSGTGVHCIVQGSWDAGRRRKINDGGLEVYSQGRYFAITGNLLTSLPSEIRNHEDLMMVLGEYFAPAHAGRKEKIVMTGSRDEDIICRASSARNGAKFRALWHGDTTEYGNDASRADLALCGILAFWTKNDCDQMDRLFRRSGLMRDKWDERHRADGATYGEVTISKAIR